MISFVIAMASIVLFCGISKVLVKTKMLKRVFLYFGRNSLIVLAFHTLVRDYGVSPIIWGITGQFYATEWVRWVYIVGSLILCVFLSEVFQGTIPGASSKEGKS